MPVITRLVSMALRVGELIFAAVVAGIIGSYLRSFHHTHAWPHARYIYTEVIAGLSIVLALFWLLPFVGGFIHWPTDLILAAAWFAVFGLLVNAIGPMHCGAVFHWQGITRGGTCNKWKAAEAFSFLSVIFWLVSALLGIWFMHRTRRERAVPRDETNVAAPGTTAEKRRGAWYRRSRV